MWYTYQPDIPWTDAVNYPTFKPVYLDECGGRLMVCDRCKQATWFRVSRVIHFCDNKSCNRRLREANEFEVAEALRVLRTAK